MRWIIVLILAIVFSVSCNKAMEEGPAFQDPPPDYRLRILSQFDQAGNQTREISFDYDQEGFWIDSGNVYSQTGHLLESAWPAPWQRPYPVLYHYNDFDLIDTISGLIPGHEQRVVFHYRIRKLEGITVTAGGKLSHSFSIDHQGENAIAVSQKDGKGTMKDSTYLYHFDNARLPFPRSYLLKNSWYPVKVSNLISEHNLLEITSSYGDESETIEVYRYEYDIYGFPVTQYASDGSRTTFEYQ